MYLKRLFTCFVAVFCGLHAHAQTIEIDFPAHAGKTYEVIIFQGNRTLKLVENDTIPAGRPVTIEIPEAYSPYSGVLRWLITNTEQGGGLEMVVPGRGFKVSSDVERPMPDEIRWEGYDAYGSMNEIREEVYPKVEKYRTISRLMQLYNSDDAIYSSLLQEQKIQKQSYEEYVNNLSLRPEYAARHWMVEGLMNGLTTKLTTGVEEYQQAMDSYTVNSLDFDVLYTSGFWSPVIQGWVQVNAQVFNDKEKFARDFEKISQRITDPDMYTDFVGQVTYNLNVFGKDDFVEAIAGQVISSNKITAYEGKTMEVYITAMPGKQGPDLVITEHVGEHAEHNHETSILKSSELAGEGFDYSLLVFYQSGCGPCEELMQVLPGVYGELKNEKVRLITLSADVSEELYAATSRDYPWPDKYCDFAGKDGVNFKRYAIPGTPTLVLLGKDGKILQRAGSLANIRQYLSEI